MFEAANSCEPEFLCSEQALPELLRRLRKSETPGLSAEKMPPRRFESARREDSGSVTPKLNRRLKDVLLLLSRGFTNREIAVQVGVSPSTARNYVSELLGRLNARNRSELTRRAMELGLIGAARLNDSQTRESLRAKAAGV